MRACAVGGQIILLDLRRNRYLGVAGERFGALSSIVSGWPDPEGTSQPARLSRSDFEALAMPLLRRGLLTPICQGLNADPTLPEAAQSLNADDAIDRAAVGTRRMLRLVRTGTSASMWLRCRSLQSIAQCVASRRARALTTPIQAASQPLRLAVAAYLRLRPLLFTAHDRCLHDSLNLLGFLAAEGWFPNWVIGVATQPFRAHAWVQSGDLVVGDLHENVRCYTPILTA